MFNGRKPVTLAELNTYKSALDQQDSIYYPLYDYQTYPLLGQQLFTFFSVPKGQGATSQFGGAGPKTLQDTNMQTAGQLPAGNQFLIKGIEVEFFPSVMPAFGAAAAIAAGKVAVFLQDVYTVLRNGVLNLRVQDRDYVTDGPLMKFPTQTRIAGFGSVNETTNATASNAQIDYASGVGLGYNIVPLRLFSNQAFAATITFPALIPTPSAADGRIGVRLVGDLVRNAQ